MNRKKTILSTENNDQDKTLNYSAKTDGLYTKDKFTETTNQAKLANNDNAYILYLNSALLDESALIRKHSAQLLGELGPSAALAVLNLAFCLKDTCAEVRENAARALGQINAPSEFVTEALCDAMSDFEPQVRLQATITLGKLKVISIRIALTLENALTDHDKSVKQAAQEALDSLRKGKYGRFNNPLLVA